MLQVNRKTILIALPLFIFLSVTFFLFLKNEKHEDIASEEIKIQKNIVNNYFSEKENISIIQNLNLFMGIKEDLFNFKKETVFQFLDRIVEKENDVIVKQFTTIKVPEDYELIQTAIDNAEKGDRIEVAVGEYFGNIIMKEGVNLIGLNISKENKKLVVENSESTSLSVGQVILNGKNIGNVVTFKNGITNKTELSGFVIKNAGENLSGVFIEDASPWVHDNIISENEYNIYIKGKSFPVIQKNIIQFANKGIQIYNFEKEEEEDQKFQVNIIDNLIIDNKIGIDLYQSFALINHNTISYNNHYKNYLGATFGIYLNNSSANILNNIITDNGFCDLCAGINIDKKSSKVVIDYNNIWNNKNNFVCFGECLLEETNFSEDPLFIGYLEGGYILGEESGLIGKSNENLNLGVRW